MGYTTDFEGSLSLSKNLTDEQKNYINTFSNTRRMKRDVNKLMELYHGNYGYPGVPETADPNDIYGYQGEFFAMDDGYSGQKNDESVIDHNTPSESQPGLWCQWVITGTVEQQLEWDCGEKFYDYVDWLKYLIDKFFSKWGVLLNGEIYWYGEDSDDLGVIVVKDNVIKIKYGEIVYK